MGPILSFIIILYALHWIVLFCVFLLQIASLTGTEVDGFNSYNYNSGSICSSPSGPDLSNLFVTSHSRSSDKLVGMAGDDADYEMKNSRSMSEVGISPSSPKYDNFRSVSKIYST